MRRIAASSSPGEVRIALLEGDMLADYAIWRPGAPDGLGDIHLGRVIAAVPAMAGAFVLLADGEEGFLPDSAGAAGRSVGEAVQVRVVRASQGGKGPRLAALQAELPPAVHAPARLRRGPGAIERLACLHPEAAITIDDAALAASLRPLLGGRLHVVQAAFDAVLEAELASLADPSIELPGGMRGTIVPTPALTAIDLDGGSGTAARAEKSAAQFAANRAALPGLARQIRLRNLSGAILVDLAGLPVRRREALGRDFAAALADDPALPRLLGFTRLGLAEILRPRLHPPLHELIAGPFAAGLAALREAARSMAAEPARRLLLRANPAVVAALQADPVALPDLARRGAHPLMLRSDPALPACQWTIDDAPSA